MSERTSSRELSDALDLEFFLDRESIDYKLGRGRSGEQFNVQTCPLCGHDKWRVYLNAENGLGNCFVCGDSFTKLGFIHAYLGHGDGQWGQTFRYVEEVLKDQGWRPRRVAPVCVDETKVELPLSMALPTKDGQTLVYLRDRGIDEELTRFFHLRYCQEGWWNYTKADGTTGGQNFKERVIIPVYDLDGELKTFQGRDITGVSDTKYLFPSGLPGTGRYLYNGQNAGPARRAVMGEGAFDVYGLKIACDGAQDLRDVAAIGSFGKHLSYGSPDGDDQLGRLLRMKRAGLQELIICWDGEAKALLAALDAAKLVTGIGLKVRIALMPRDKDPGETAPHLTQKALREAVPYSPLLHLQWQVKNPYALPARQQSILTAHP